MASTAGALSLSGTVFPLLPRRTLKVFNVGVQVYADTPGLVSIADMLIYLQFFADPDGNIPISNAAINLAAGGWTGSAFLGSNAGFALAQSGDPLIELYAGAIVTGQPVTPRSAQLGFLADVLNTDAINDHTVTFILSGLLAESFARD